LTLRHENHESHEGFGCAIFFNVVFFMIFVVKNIFEFAEQP